MLNLYLMLIITLVTTSQIAHTQKLNDKNKKNVLLLLADDGGFEMGAYRNHIVQTPNLDYLAKQSLIFNNAFATVSSCSPSRAAILTGLPSHQSGMYGLHQGLHHFNSFSYIKSLPSILKENKIKTGIIGKKHVGPSKVFKFDYERTEEKYSINQVGRNITQIKLFVREFLSSIKEESFFLMVSFHDPHRCGRVTPEYGSFCERFGSGENNMGTIPDWKPIYYVWDEIQIPYYVPDTELTRRDLAAQYTTISRLDQGVGLVLKEFQDTGLINSTLVFYTSDNGVPFPNARTNLYDAGTREPMFLSSPFNKKRKNQVTYAMATHLDITPTILDWFNISYNSLQSEKVGEDKIPKKLRGKIFFLTGKSLLPLLDTEPKPNNESAVFMSQNFHEITMNYPMRAIRTNRYKLIHNLNYASQFPIDQDLYVSPTFQDILNRTINKQPLPWSKSLQQYYQRKEWELYDLRKDPEELNNIAGKKSMEQTHIYLRNRLKEWLIETNDPWRCAPHMILEDAGPYKDEPVCLTLGHTNNWN